MSLCPQGVMSYTGEDPLIEPGRPLGAFIFSLIGGILIFIEGIFLGLAAGVATSEGVAPVGGALAGLAALAIFLGLLLMILAIVLYLAPEMHVGLGVAILLFSLLSIFAGAGFWLGLIFGVVGSVLAIVFHPDPEYVAGLYSTSGPEELEPARRVCSHCGASIAADVSYCPRCGTSTLVARGLAARSTSPETLPPPRVTPLANPPAVAASDQPFRACPSCLRVIPAGSPSCPVCGAAIARA